MDVLPSLGVALWVLFAAALLLSATLGVALAYHWSKYAMNPVMPVIASAVYAVVSIVLLVGLLALALSV